jgi:hypothetical protein
LVGTGFTTGKIVRTSFKELYKAFQDNLTFSPKLNVQKSVDLNIGFNAQNGRKIWGQGCSRLRNIGISFVIQGFFEPGRF